MVLNDFFDRNANSYKRFFKIMVKAKKIKVKQKVVLLGGKRTYETPWRVPNNSAQKVPFNSADYSAEKAILSSSGSLIDFHAH